MSRASRWRTLFHRIGERVGPGVITGAADDDPSGIATYAAAGAQFGYRTIWAPIFLIPFMAAIQEMCARIGIVTHHGLAGTMRRHYSKLLLFCVAAIVFAANTINIGADIAAVAASVRLLTPKIPQALTAVVFVILILSFMVFSSYLTIVRVFKWLTLALLFYMFSAFAAHPDWGRVVISTVIPQVELTKPFLLLLVALFGTTISPYLFFWQASSEAEERLLGRKHGWLKRFIISREEIKTMRTDVIVGMILSNVVMYFVIAATAATLHPHGVTTISTAEQVATALEPFAGRWSSLLFTLGIVGTGALAIPVLAGSAAYAVAEAFGWPVGLNRPFHKAQPFYLVLTVATVLGLVLTLLEIDPIKLLVYTAVLYGFISPPLVALVLHIANNRSLMGRHANTPIDNALGALTLLVMSVAAVLLLVL